MIVDIRAVMWKEWRGLFRQRGGRTRTLLTMASPVGLAVYFPLGIGEDWVDMFFPVILASRRQYTPPRPTASPSCSAPPLAVAEWSTYPVVHAVLQ